MKNTFYSAAIITPLLVVSLTASAENACLSGQPQKSNLIAQLAKAQASSSVTQIIMKQYQLGAYKTEAECKECKQTLANAPADVKPLANHIDGIPSAPQMLFKPECMIVANSFSAGEKKGEVLCPEGKRSINAQLCVNQDLMTYQNAVISSSLSCLKKLNLPTVSPSMLFQIFSRESTFRPQYASANGHDTGLGQVQPIFVRDVQQKGRGSEILGKIAQSDLSECAAPKIIASKDLKSKPQLNSQNLCAFTSVGEGLERNVLYSLVGMATLWQKNLSRRLKKFESSPNLQNIKDVTIASAYGYGGLASAYATIRRLSQLPTDKISAASENCLSFKTKRSLAGQDATNNCRGINSYIAGLAQRRRSIAEKLSEPLKSQVEKGVQSCVN